ncbi:uncharacterized protein METZ01_LOCUS239061 [marine metagenome]|uniref:Uncharacterized protein n=1 Tax=marine metagenome TaxID=408172 RepID=A0A382HH11_9ZZZZ
MKALVLLTLTTVLVRNLILVLSLEPETEKGNYLRKSNSH